MNFLIEECPLTDDLECRISIKGYEFIETDLTKSEKVFLKEFGKDTGLKDILMWLSVWAEAIERKNIKEEENKNESATN